jgi:competence protein ComFC
MKMIDVFLNLLYPKRSYCVVCGGESRAALCSTCTASVRFIEGRCCLKCGKALEDSYYDNICSDCQSTPHRFRAAYSCFQYEGMGKELIHTFKYKGRLEIGELLAEYMHQKLKDEGIRADYIVPVPIHQSKLQKRGFNQSQVIAKQLSLKMGIPLIECLIRTKETARQYDLGRVERFKNVFNAFEGDLSYNIENKIILLVDDIYTTGSTVDECSKVLQVMGASCIYVVTAASGKNI